MDKLTYLMLRQIERGATSPQFSQLEQKFPRIAMRLVEVWQTDACRDYLNSLLMDNRGGRQGFPADVMDELLMLDNIQWSIRPGDTSRGIGGHDFTFGGSPGSIPPNRETDAGQSWFNRLFA